MAIPKKRTSKTQFELYLNEIEKNPVLINGKMEPSRGPEYLLNSWENLATQLNSCGDGPIRSVTEWKKVFTEWKSATRKKAREGKTTSDQERKLIVLLGSGAVTGLPVNEIGYEAEHMNNEEFTVPPEENDEENIVIEVIDESSHKTPQKKKRSKKIIQSQYEMYINYLENKSNFGDLCAQLNNVPSGPTKTIAEWQQAFWNWSCSVKRKAREIYVHQHGTGGGLPIQVVLTELEEMLLQVLGKLVIIGMPTIELGLPKKKITNKERVTKKDVKRISYPVVRRCRDRKTMVSVLNKFSKYNGISQESLGILINSIETLKSSLIRFLNIKLNE